jgi:hypothetical protein
MNAAVANMDTVSQITRRARGSNRSRRVWAAGAIVAAAAVLTVVDTPLTRSRSSEHVAVPAWPAAAPTLRDSSPAAEATDVPGRAPLVVRFSKPMAAASVS